MNMTAEKKTIDLSWVAAAGGPEIERDAFGHVTGLPEQGWNSWDWAGGELSLNVEWTEPTTLQAGTLLFSIKPSEQGLKWEACFVWHRTEGERECVIPIRGRGVACDFNAARQAALAWRPLVSVIDGIQLWTDPNENKGAALELTSGSLEWRIAEEKGKRVLWNFHPNGMADVMKACGGWVHNLRGEADSLQQMLDQASEAREQMRAAMRKFLLSY